MVRVKRIVPNIQAADTSAAKRFYGDALGLETAMDLGWIVTFAAADNRPVQVSVASEGGSGMPVPALSIEVDDLEAAHARMVEAGFTVEYGPVEEPWGVRRFFVRDPHGTLVNVLSHL